MNGLDIIALFMSGIAIGVNIAVVIVTNTRRDK